jgi:hypothetical protein
MQRTNVLSIQRISAQDRAKIEAVDPAIQLTDAEGWYDGRNSRDLACLHLGTVSGAKPQAWGPKRNAIASWLKQRLAISARSARQGTEVEMVSSVPCGRQQFAHG